MSNLEQIIKEASKALEVAPVDGIANRVPEKLLGIISPALYKELYKALMTLDAVEAEVLFEDIGKVVAQHTDLGEELAKEFINGMKKQRAYIAKGPKN